MYNVQGLFIQNKSKQNYSGQIVKSSLINQTQIIHKVFFGGPNWEKEYEKFMACNCILSSASSAVAVLIKR